MGAGEAARHVPKLAIVRESCRYGRRAFGHEGRNNVLTGDDHARRIDAESRPDDREWSAAAGLH